MPTTWSVHHLGPGRFPYRVAIERDGRTVLAVRAAAPWPGPGQQVFCLREDGSDPAGPSEPVEQCPVVSLNRIGRKLAVVLDRAQRKRCEFLFVTKPRRDGSGDYEQVFFRTESGIRAHRSRTRAEVQPRAVKLDVVVDSGEKYAWRFPGATVTTRRLAVGDYALAQDERITAVVERKSYDNVLGELGALQAWHHALADLARQERSALVIEAQYGDFLDERRLAGRWPVAHVARVLAEVAVLHPRLPIVYAGTRKLANQWTYRFFLASATHRESRQLEFMREDDPARTDWSEPIRGEEKVRVAAISEGAPFTLRELAERLALPLPFVRRVLGALAQEGKVRCTGRGRAARWERV